MNNKTYNKFGRNIASALDNSTKAVYTYDVATSRISAMSTFNTNFGFNSMNNNNLQSKITCQCALNKTIVVANGNSLNSSTSNTLNNSITATSNLPPNSSILTENIASINPFRFSSEYHDSTFGLYNPTSGRWLSRDPIAEKGGYNLYGMCRNNFINLMDFRGQKVIKRPTVKGTFDRKKGIFMISDGESTCSIKASSGNGFGTNNTDSEWVKDDVNPGPFPRGEWYIVNTQNGNGERWELWWNDDDILDDEAINPENKTKKCNNFRLLFAENIPLGHGCIIMDGADKTGMTCVKKLLEKCTGWVEDRVNDKNCKRKLKRQAYGCIEVN